MAGFHLIIYGRFWVITEASGESVYRVGQNSWQLGAFGN